MARTALIQLQEQIEVIRQEAYTAAMGDIERSADGKSWRYTGAGS
jgi:hypothetical protein